MKQASWNCAGNSHLYNIQHGMNLSSSASPSAVFFTRYNGKPNSSQSRRYATYTDAVRTL